MRKARLKSHVSHLTQQQRSSSDSDSKDHIYCRSVGRPGTVGMAIETLRSSLLICHFRTPKQSCKGLQHLLLEHKKSSDGSGKGCPRANLQRASHGICSSLSWSRYDHLWGTSNRMSQQVRMCGRIEGATSFTAEPITQHLQLSWRHLKCITSIIFNCFPPWPLKHLDISN